jgi:pSer/pThr/pTyr-binding forkhead associated (FHA) protein
VAARVAARRLALPSEGAVVIGRSSSCDVTLGEPTISRRHLELRALDESWLAVDLGSTNGTWLLGQRLGRARVLPGDELVLGECPIELAEPALTTSQPS